jgi:hypothetical protein
MSISLVDGGSFTSTGNTQEILIPGGADYFKTFNVTQAGTTQATGRGFMFEWFADNTPINGALEWFKTNATNAVNMNAITSGGFTYYNGATVMNPTQTGTAITNASPAVATATNTLSNGDRIRVWNVVGMKQISTMQLSVSSVSGSGFTLAGLPAASFSAAGTTFSFRKILPSQLVLPQYLFVTAISLDTNCVITVSTLNDYVPGMKIRLDVPSVYGCPQADGVEATILAINGTTVPINGTPTALSAYQIQLNVNSSGWGTFTFPTSANATSVSQFATLAPDGQTAYYNLLTQTQYGYNVSDAPFRSAFPTPYMLLAAGAQSPAGSLGDLIEYQWFRYQH